MDIHDCIQLIVLTRQQNFRLHAVYKCFVLIQAGYELVSNRFALTSEFHESFEICKLAGYLAVKIQGFLKTGALAQDLAGAFLIGVEVWFGNLLLEFIELSLLGLNVKETSALPDCVF